MCSGTAEQVLGAGAEFQLCSGGQGRGRCCAGWHGDSCHPSPLAAPSAPGDRGVPGAAVVRGDGAPGGDRLGRWWNSTGIGGDSQGDVAGFCGSGARVAAGHGGGAGTRLRWVRNTRWAAGPGSGAMGSPWNTMFASGVSALGNCWSSQELMGIIASDGTGANCDNWSHKPEFSWRPGAWQQGRERVLLS